MAAKSENKSPHKKPLLIPRFRVACGKTIALGPGKVELLGFLLETGSLNKAAQRMNMSYMRAWMLVNQMNKCFREPVAVAVRGGRTGGGMKVTETGRRAFALYRKMESNARSSTAVSWRSFQKLLRA
jgi:molybdate transport system regulatory protein